jgi:hypothetical protein
MQELLRSYIRARLIEAKVDIAKQRHPEFADVLDRVNAIHPKYLEWSTKQLVAGAKVEDLVPTLRVFDARGSQLEKRDITAYHSLKELEDAVKSLPPSKRSQKQTSKLNGAEKIYEDERYTLLFIKDKKASMCYGAGTKWCITMGDASYYEEYTLKGVIFYFVINKVLRPEDPMAKVAFAIYRDENLKVTEYEIFDALDNPIKQVKAPYDKFLAMSKEDAKTRPEPAEVTARRLYKQKIMDGMASHEEMTKYIESIPEEGIEAFVEDVDENIRRYPTEFFKVLIEQTYDSEFVRLGLGGLKTKNVPDDVVMPLFKHKVFAVKNDVLRYVDPSRVIEFVKQLPLGDEYSNHWNSLIYSLARKLPKSDREKAIAMNDNPMLSASIKRIVDFENQTQELQKLSTRERMALDRVKHGG